MSKGLSPKIHAEITAVIETAVKGHVLVRVYAEAEKIRCANLADNIALEDIVQEIMDRSANGPGYEADPLDAIGAIMGDASATTKPLH